MKKPKSRRELLMYLWKEKKLHCSIWKEGRFYVVEKNGIKFATGIENLSGYSLEDWYSLINKLRK